MDWGKTEDYFVGLVKKAAAARRILPDLALASGIERRPYQRLFGFFDFIVTGFFLVHSLQLVEFGL